MTGLELLQWSTNTLKDHQIENPRLDAELLLTYSLNLSREELYVRLRREVKAGEKGALERLVQRRISGEPLQYILGHQEFWSIDFEVDPRVLIPMVVPPSVSTPCRWNWREGCTWTSARLRKSGAISILYSGSATAW